ncbi:MAG: hypothetical protein EXS63_04635 [Candidatus Omnitrophica bacterium]|nr:hypothetical protein [Candidatus Omnitrophota bacterium]
MKNRYQLSVIFLIMITLLSFPVMAETTTDQPPVASTKAHAKKHQKHEKEMRFPKIHRVLHKITEAKLLIEKISLELNGHKAKAAQLLDQAAEELNTAMTEEKEARKAKKEATQNEPAAVAPASDASVPASS